MIFYFSGTGNSKWVAEEIAKKTNDTAINISNLAETPQLNNEEKIGFVFPIYAWSVAEPMMNFIKTLPTVNAFTYGICTCGSDAGLSMKRINKVYKLNSAYSVIMPDNYVVGFDIESPNNIAKKLINAKTQIESIATEINDNKCVYSVNEGKIALIKTNIVAGLFNKFARSTKPFYATKSCTGCGICVESCPLKTISIEDKMPKWSNQCYQCMACINGCPQKAIQYGKKTTTRGRYVLQKYL